MASPSVTYTFSNSTTADATQVNQNFTDIINGITDGTKDLSINALTCAGAATLNGNVTLGNASGDDITVTGSLASSVAIKTTNTYDIGAATLALRSVYLASADGAARSTRVIGATVASSYTLTLPTSAGTTGMTAITDGSGTLSFRYIEKTTAKTTTYTGTGDETTILCDATSAAFTVTLPAAASYTGKHYYIKKTDSSTNAVTIDGNSSETIDGATTTTLNTQYEAIKIVCDGSNWHIVERKIPSVWTSYTPTIAGYGTGSGTPTAAWRRVGDSIELDIKILKDGSAGSGTTAITATVPSGVTLDTSKTIGDNLGWAHLDTANFGALNPVVYSSATVLARDGGTAQNITGGHMVAGSTLFIRARFAVSGWNG